MNEKLENALETFLTGCQAKVNKNHERFEYLTTPILKLESGKRYIRVVKDDGNQRSVYCFIDQTNGDVLKAASWKAPARHARGNIFNPDNGLNGMGPYGAAYLR